MTSDELGISLDSDLARSIRDAAKRSGKDLSDWLAEAATVKLRNDALGEFLDEWEGENGPITVEELYRARVELGLAGEQTSG